jgi:hypothetical protein
MKFFLETIWEPEIISCLNHGRQIKSLPARSDGVAASQAGILILYARIANRVMSPG